MPASKCKSRAHDFSTTYRRRLRVSTLRLRFGAQTDSPKHAHLGCAADLPQ
jgi:hypothetical protein